LLGGKNDFGDDYAFYWNNTVDFIGGNKEFSLPKGYGDFCKERIKLASKLPRIVEIDILIDHLKKQITSRGEKI
jgi:hypothetical protein